jgi:hypothetical protein
MNGLNPNPVIPVHEQNLSPRSPLSTVSISSPPTPIADQHNLQQNYPNHYTSELPVQFSRSLANGTVSPN